MAESSPCLLSPCRQPPIPHPHSCFLVSGRPEHTHTQPCRSPTWNTLMAFNLPLNKSSRISPQLSYRLVVICLSFHVTAWFSLLKTPASTMYSYLLVSLIPFPRLAAEWGVNISQGSYIAPFTGNLSHFLCPC